MSLTKNGSEVRCDGRLSDGAACGERAAVPIALRSRLSAGDAPRQENATAAITGWMFVTDGGRVRHFCPRCGRLCALSLEGGGEALPTLVREV